MKKNLVRVSLLFVLLAAAPQIISASTVPGQINTNSNTAPKPMPGPINPCQKRCRWEYRKCLHAAGADPAKRKACAARYRWCLRHCYHRR